MIKINKFLITLVLTSVILFFGCKKDKYVEVIGKCPIVVSTIPVDKATGVPVNQVISATFNERMNPATLPASCFTLMGATKISGKFSYNDSDFTISFIPDSALAHNTTYTGKIASTVKDMMGNALQTDYIWTFSTGALIVPIVISTDPASNETGVVLNKIIAATFNMPMDPLTITNASFIVKQGVNPVAGTVSYSGNTASFTPANLLTSSTIYTCTITTGSKNTVGTALTNNYSWTFITGVIVAPMVILTDPVNKATGVALNKVISATFSMAMDPATITNASFNVRQGGNTVSGVVSYNGSTASFTPAANLLSGTLYTATITTGAKNILGTPMANNYVWTFTTIGITAPTVIYTDPANTASGVALNKIVTATFSVPMDPLTISGTTFKISQGVNSIAGTISYSGTTASFTPSSPFASGTIYTGTITTGAKNIAGTAIAKDYIWTFTTGILLAPTVISTDPANNETGVALNKSISATFSIAMNPLTLTSSTFYLKQGANIITGSISYSGSTVVFNPSADLKSGTVYTASITTGAKNMAGTPLASNYVWSFTTITIIAPTVISTDPSNKATNVPLSQVISAVFSVNMDAMTINSSTFKLSHSGSPVSGTVSYSGKTASFTPSSLLLSDATYTATITSGVKDVPGTPMANNYVWTFSTKAHAGPIGPDLKTAGRFGILAGVGISNNAGPSKINDMDVGIYPGKRSSVTGFPPATVNNGAIYCSDDLSPAGVAAMLKQAKLDLTAAYLYAEGATNPAPATVSGDQGGKTLAPGIYKSTSTLKIQNGDLTLDAKGDVNAVWIFQIASGFTTVGGSGGNVILSGGAQAKNIYWQVGSSATIGDYTSFKGNVLAYTSITMNAYSTAVGRMLAINAAVVMTSTNTIDKP